MMGSTEYNDEQPEHELDLPYGYWIGQSPITVAQYAAFIEAGGYGNRDWWSAAGWEWKGDKTGPEDYWRTFYTTESSTRWR